MKKAVLLFALIGVVSFAQAEKIRIACIGNSITVYHGTYPTLDLDSYPAQLRILMGEGYDIQNFGVSGRTLLKKGDYPIWNEAAFAGALAFQPNIVTIMLGTNDSKPQNWAFKDEFIADYEAMIDTFRALDSHPEIYVCIPAPAFSSKYDISGPVIADEMIPMLQQIIQDKNTPFIDFHTPFIDKSDMFYDGIHPTLDGLWEFAKIFDSALNPNPIAINEVRDVNLALNGTVLSSGLSKAGFTLNFEDPTANLVDGNIGSVYACKDSGWVTVDLGAVDSTDMVQIIFKESGKFGYLIEKSDDNANWATVVDQFNSQAAINVAAESIEPTAARYIRFTFQSADQTQASIPVAELRVLKPAPAHAPIVTFNLTKVTAKQAYFNVLFASALKGGYLKYYFYEIADTLYTAGVGNGYRLEDQKKLSFGVIKGREKYFYAKYYNNGFEVTSDTLKVDYDIATSVNTEESRQPGQFKLNQNYPNPFNPSTIIGYELPTSAKVKMTIYDCLGREVKMLVNQFQKAGSYSVQFHSQGLSSGLYFCRLEADDFETTRRLVLLK